LLRSSRSGMTNGKTKIIGPLLPDGVDPAA
jgi:hypothetical protein